jgi:diadenosine tetraphosphatase ApaH/serine/threonine PP2A family protein phosphatase
VRYLVISDIHGNLEALDAVLGAMRAQGFDHALVLGDLVGYGADPNAVVDRVRSLSPLSIIRGNHDKVASGLENGDSFNLVARSAVQWTYEMLTPENLDYLLKLPAGPIAVDDKVEICHGSPFDEDAYISTTDALRTFEVSTRPVCLFERHHASPRTPPAGPPEMPAGPGARPGAPADQRRARYLVSVSSVGQPRDATRALPGIVGTTAGTIEHRVRYAVEEAQRRSDWRACLKSSPRRRRYQPLGAETLREGQTPSSRSRATSPPAPHDPSVRRGEPACSLEWSH